VDSSALPTRSRKGQSLWSTPPLHPTSPVTRHGAGSHVTRGIEPKPSKAQAKLHAAQLCCDALGYCVSEVRIFQRLSSCSMRVHASFQCTEDRRHCCSQDGLSLKPIGSPVSRNASSVTPATVVVSSAGTMRYATSERVGRLSNRQLNAFISEVSGFGRVEARMCSVLGLIGYVSECCHAVTSSSSVSVSRTPCACTIHQPDVNTIRCVRYLC
jgi:hypothetical protein